MAHYRMQLSTALPPDEAFAFMADLRNFTEWDPGVSSAEQVAGHGPGPDAAYDIEASGAMLRYEVEHYDAPTEVRARAANRFVTSVDTIVVDAAPGGSTVTYEAELTLNGILRFGDPLLGLAFKRIGDKAAAGLTERLGATRVS